ncbi:MAG: hypothetical protein KBT03_11045 [Bacteroidales bacterium]|nr:hypothetical protein [Candidatus Scybalousia scybalohippi]
MELAFKLDRTTEGRSALDADAIDVTVEGKSKNLQEHLSEIVISSVDWDDKSEEQKKNILNTYTNVYITE